MLGLEGKRQGAYKVTIYAREHANLSITWMVGSNTHLQLTTMVLWCKNINLANGYFDTEGHFANCKFVFEPTILIVV